MGLSGGPLQAGAASAGDSIPMACLSNVFPVPPLLGKGVGVRDVQSGAMAKRF